MAGVVSQIAGHGRDRQPDRRARPRPSVGLPRGDDHVVRVEDVHLAVTADERQADVDLARVSAQKPEALGHRFEGLVQLDHLDRKRRIRHLPDDPDQPQTSNLDPHRTVEVLDVALDGGDAQLVAPSSLHVLDARKKNIVLARWKLWTEEALKLVLPHGVAKVRGVLLALLPFPAAVGEQSSGPLLPTSLRGFEHLLLYAQHLYDRHRIVDVRIVARKHVLEAERRVCRIGTSELRCLPDGGGEERCEKKRCRHAQRGHRARNPTDHRVLEESHMLTVSASHLMCQRPPDIGGSEPLTVSLRRVHTHLTGSCIGSRPVARQVFPEPTPRPHECRIGSAGTDPPRRDALMTDPGRHRTAAVAAGLLLLLASALNAGTVIDLASESVPAVHGAFEEEQFGYCLAAGDFEADGDIEIVVGAPGLTDSIAGTHVGGVYVFRLSALDTLSTDVSAATLAEWTIAGSGGRGRFGSAVAVADLDGDGFDDLAVGAPGAGRDGAIARGEVSVYFGGPGGSLSLGPGAAPEIVLEGTCPGARLGWSILAGDLDDDGAAELLLSEPQGGGTGGARPGAIHVTTGTALRSVSGAVVVVDVAVSSIEGESAGDALSGMALTDTDGDGALELVLGAYLADGPGMTSRDAGKLYVVAVREVLEQRSLSLPTAGARPVSGLTERGFLGRSMAAGDIDSDGIGDLLVSAYASGAHGKKLVATGEAFVLFGDSGSTGEADANRRTLDDPAVPRFHGASRSDLLGFTVLLADLNGDRSADIVMASQYADGPDGKRTACGEIYIYWGSLRSVVTAKAGSAELADVTIVGQSAGDSIGAALLTVETSGDGRPGLLIGAADASGTEDDGEVSPRHGKLILLPGELLLR